MKVRVSTYTYRFTILLGLALAFILFQLTNRSEVYTLIIFFTFFLWLFLESLRVGNLSYDNDRIYLKRLGRELLLEYSNVVKIQRAGGVLLNETNINHRYKLVYLGQDGREKRCIFYIPEENILVWDRFKQKLLKESPLVEIRE